MVFDDYFETIHCSEIKPPDNWNDLIVLSSFRSDIDEEDYIPELSDEWKTPEELQTPHNVKEPMLKDEKQKSNQQRANAGENC